MVTSVELQSRLEDVFGGQLYGIQLISSCRKDYLSASINAMTSDSTVPVGCIAKLLTATLVAIAQMEGRLSLHSRLTFHLPLSDRFADLCIGHLLNHTSGLDHSVMDTVAKQADLFHDRAALLRCVEASQILARPGVVFNYSNLGPWLAATVLEAIYEQCYVSLLEEKIFRPLNISVPLEHITTSICPSIGNKLRLSANDLLKIAALHLHGDIERPMLLEHLKALRSLFGFTLAGSVLAAEKAFPGCFDYGDSFGQLGYGAEGSALIRLVPDDAAVIVVTTTHANLATPVLAALKSDTLRDLKSNLFPTFLSRSEWQRTDSSFYTGYYVNGRYLLSLDTARNGALRGKVYYRSGHADDEGKDTFEQDVLEQDAPIQSSSAQEISEQNLYLKRYFKAATDNSFIPLDPEPNVIPRLHFSHFKKGIGFQYVSTGHYVFARIQYS